MKIKRKKKNKASSLSLTLILAVVSIPGTVQLLTALEPREVYEKV